MMKKLLITGAKGFVGRNTVAQLATENRFILLEADIDTEEALLNSYIDEADFVIHLAGVNRPKDEGEFVTGNTELTERLVERLSCRELPPPLLMTSSIQSDLDNPYGRSKRDAEKAVFSYREHTGSDVYVFKLPNLFGKWSRPNYNSVVSTFCHNIANGLDIRIDDPGRVLTLVYIDDLLEAILRAVDGELYPEPDGYCSVNRAYTITLKELADTIYSFRELRNTLVIPELSGLTKKLYSTYLSYLAEDDFAYGLAAHTDVRGSFVELLKTAAEGQISVSTTAPGITRGNHWHNTKVEKFIVICGNAEIRFRKIGSDRVISYMVDGDDIQVVDIPVGYTHSITNISKIETLVTIIWANELFDSGHPDTFYEEV